jgi:hypothetical protein
MPALPVQDYLDYDGSKPLPDTIVATQKEMRDAFFDDYMKWKNAGVGIDIYSDVGFPVETNFFSAVIADGNGLRDWDGPFPLKDVAPTITDKRLLAEVEGDAAQKNKDGVTTDIDRNVYSGLTDLKKHNPLDDARASAYSFHRAERELEQAIVANYAAGTEIAEGKATAIASIKKEDLSIAKA